MSNGKSIWGEHQVGLFQNGVTSESFPDDTSALGVLNTLAPVTFYVFMTPGFERYILKHLPSHIGINGVTLETPVIENSTRENLGTIRTLIGSIKEVERKANQLEQLGYDLYVDELSRDWRIKIKTSLEPDSHDHPFSDLHCRSKGEIVEQALSRIN